MMIGRRRDGAQGYAIRLNNCGALETSFASIHRTFTCFFDATRGFDDATIDGYVVEIQTDHPVVSIEHYIVQLIHHSGRDPFGAGW
jgi:hypothetical protein